jgi:diguanylate cyclase (GGDEF)-like protein
MEEDLDGEALSTVPKPVDPPEVVRLALELARVVAAVHQRGVVHRDVNPANIVLAGPERSPHLVDFALATTFADVRPGFTHQNEIVGTLPYLAPEQTGRTGRAVDRRADLYGLGATLYELATGRPPFGTGDPLRLSHDHLARAPVPPAQANSAVPAPLSDVIMHLLEKEPDRRYQTADGLAHDLAQLQAQPAEPLTLGASDFPARLSPPARLVERDEELTALEDAFSRATEGRCRGVLISGASGIGKTALIDELRAIASAGDGWFVTGKFDQYRRDQEFDGVRQAFRALGRLLLAEPEDQLAGLRERLWRGLGPNAGLAAAVLPEFAVLLNATPDPGDPLTAQVRAKRVAVEILRAVTSHRRPVVFAIDDLQWAPRTPLSFVDAVFSGEEEFDGLLLVGAYREDEVDAMHPLSSMLSRWPSCPVALARVRLDSLSTAGVTGMLVDTLRLDEPKAGALAEVIAPYTGGNPFDVIQLLNVLRHDGVLRAGARGWHWDISALRRRVGTADVGRLAQARADVMPAATRDLLDAMACLAGRVDLDTLGAATDLTPAEVSERLTEAVEDGLLVVEPGERDVVRFQHDRARESILDRQRPRGQRELRLRLARRLAERSDLVAVAAEQYAAVVDEVTDPDERRRVVDLLCRAAQEATMLSNHAVVERVLSTATPVADASDGTLLRVQNGRHAALYSLGRLDEADEVYRDIVRLSTPIQRVEATVIQVSSLTNRNQPHEAIDLALDLLRRLGWPVPLPHERKAGIERGLKVLNRWLDSPEADDVRRPEVTDPVTRAVGSLMGQVMAPAYFCDHETLAWVAFETARVWAEDGPCRTLVPPISHLAAVTLTLWQDYRTGFRATRRILAMAEARGYEPEAAHASFVYAVGTGHWFDPLEGNVLLAQRAREGLLDSGDLQKTCHSYFATLPQLLDCGSTVEEFTAETETALAFAQRTGNDDSAVTFRAYQRLARSLVGPVPDTAPCPDGLAGNVKTRSHVLTTRALTAVLRDDWSEVDRYTADLAALLPAAASGYPSATAQVIRALALCRAIPTTPAGRRADLVSELDSVVDWLGARAADAPENFRHLLRLVEAERAWAVGDFRAAVSAFDAAQHEVMTRRRPWHRAFILERSARFYLAHGVEHAGHSLLAEARETYLAWGAVAKAAQLDWAYPIRQNHPATPPRQPGITRRSKLSTGAIDLLGILNASQTISSETNIDRLRSRVVDVVSALTGATRIHLLMRTEDGLDWASPSPGGCERMVTLGQPGGERLVPLTVVRYAERTGEPLVVADATIDDRFARDPYLVELDRCALLAVPVLSRGHLRALLVLENHFIREAFSVERLDAVMLIAGQLAVSLDNALVYASLEHKVAERTEQLALANERLARVNGRLEELSSTDALTSLANRRRLEEVLSAEWHRAQRTGAPLSLAMVDIDHFKAYNDHFGHAAGDKCLRRVATQLLLSVRDADLVARFGGEEFAVVMPNTSIEAARQVTERLRVAIAALAEPHIVSEGQVVTVSIGAAARHPAEADTVEHLLERADRALYQAKRAGRNRVITPEPTPLVG